MAQMRGLMVTGTWIDGRLIQLQLVFYVMDDSRVWLAVGWKVYRLTAAAVHSRTRVGNFAPLHIGFRLISAGMSRQGGTLRRANLGRAKT